MVYTNIAYYKFVKLDNLEQLRDTFRQVCHQHQLKGTVILGSEGINSCLVGSEINIDAYIQFMRQDPRFMDMEFKKSYGPSIPFQRLIVKLKKEIIPIGIESVEPIKKTGRYVSTDQLQKWLAEKDDFVFLDTRNDYEVALGTFRNAVNPHLKHFRDFPDWVKNHFMEYKNKKIVTFCTGGIRCEKATAFMDQLGFQEVYQIQGGILKYFEQMAHHYPHQETHYDGDCFVFDGRVAVDQHLQPTQHKVCHKCWTVLSDSDMSHPDYKPSEQCPHCAAFQVQKKQQLVLKKQENDARALQVRKARAAAKKMALKTLG